MAGHRPPLQEPGTRGRQLLVTVALVLAALLVLGVA
ncbi:ferric siderophore transporter TonB, partial [Stenotrophomonas sp. HMWF023]